MRACAAFAAAAGTALGAVLLGAAAAQADVRDVKVGVDGRQAEIAITFDAPPMGASVMLERGAVRVFAAGVSGRPRRIEAAGEGLLYTLDVREGDGGLDLGLEIAREPTDAQAWLDGDTLHVAIALATPWTGQSAPSAAAPVRAPTQTSAHAAGPTPAPAAPAADPHAETASAPSLSEAMHGDATPEDATTAPDLRAEAPPAPGVDSHAGQNAVTHEGMEGGGGHALAAAPAPSDDAASTSAFLPDDGALDLMRPSVVFGGSLGEDACRAAEATLRADAWDLDALRRYASCLAVRGDLEEAESAFRRLLTFAPDDEEAQLGLAAVRHERGQVQAAAEVYQELLRDATSDAEAARLRALIALSASGGSMGGAGAADLAGH